MSAVFFLLGVATLIAFIVFWWKKRTARKNAGESYKDDATYKKFSLIKRGLGVACVLSFVLMVVTVPKTEKSDTSDGETATTVAEEATPSEAADSNLGFTSDDLIDGYNESIDNIGKQNSRTYNELKIDKNKVQNNSITLVDTATISWHENDGIVDAVTAVMKIPSSKAQIYEMALLATLTRNTDTLQQFLKKTKIEEQRIEISDGNIKILRIAGQNISPGVKGITLLVCTDKYYANMEKMIKVAAEKMQQEKQETNAQKGESLSDSDTLSITVATPTGAMVVRRDFVPPYSEFKKHSNAFLETFKCFDCDKELTVFTYESVLLDLKDVPDDSLCPSPNSPSGRHRYTHYYTKNWAGGKGTSWDDWHLAFEKYW